LPLDNVTEAEICEWCIDYLTKTVEAPPVEITPAARFSQIGLDSASSAYLVVELEEWLGLELPPELIFDHPTIGELAHYLAARRAGEAGDPAD
jgi:acyl carrier protein